MASRSILSLASWGGSIRASSAASASALRSVRTSTLPSASLTVFGGRRGFMGSGRVGALSESSRDTSKGTKDEIERLKDESVKKVKEGKGEHYSELGSDSESAVKADRNETNADPGMIEKVEDAAKRVVHDSAHAVKVGAKKLERATE